MSPLVDGKNVIEADGFLRNERGLKSMPHLAAFIAASTGVCLVCFSLWGFVVVHDGWIQILQIGGGLIAASAGLEGYQSTIESKNQRQ